MGAPPSLVAMSETVVVCPALLRTGLACTAATGCCHSVTSASTCLTRTLWLQLLTLTSWTERAAL